MLADCVRGSVSQELLALIVPSIVAAFVAIIASLGSTIVRYLDPDTRKAMRKDAIGEWQEIANAQKLKNAEIDERLKKTEQEAADSKAAAILAKQEAEKVKQEAERVKAETEQRRAETDAAMKALQEQVDELTQTLTERTEAGARRERQLETELEGALTELGALRGYVNQLKDLMESAGIEVPPMPAGVKPKRRRRRGKPMIKKENGGGG